IQTHTHRWTDAGMHTHTQTHTNTPLGKVLQGQPLSVHMTLHEFPTDLFTHKERTEGAVALHVLCAMYMFIALALVCDDYFVPSLEKICERLHLSEDVAGATFMAAGSSAPELFTSVIGVFITKGDVGVGTIVGSAVFNILCIIGVCGIFAGQAVKLSHWTLLRDSAYYTLSIAALIAVSGQTHTCSIKGFISNILKNPFQALSGRYTHVCMSFLCHPSVCDNSSHFVTVPIANFQCKPSVLMVDELLSAYPHQLSFSEAGMRIMITSHFSPRTRLAMASRMVINEVRSGNETENENEDNENNENDGGVEEEDENEGPLVPHRPPAGVCNKMKWLLCWPLCLLLFFTIPNCAKPRWERWFMVSFVTSTMWIAGFSYIMVWMVTVIGYTLGIPDVIMGITFLAAGTSVPDCMASLIVARQGLGDMAISNSIGSNVFDILVGLGLPWLLQTLCIDYGSTISLNSRGLIFSVALLLASVFLTVLGVHLNKWTLDRRLGLTCLLMYAVFVCFSVLIEFNVFIFVNLPMCREIL
uniref:Sodium/calcium exchanger membrane region domain-containing protein n=1 Tax=Oncorhynchus tshawytscha TaxID=74940 RepID=A0AAZ3P5B3_ONCTS